MKWKSSVTMWKSLDHLTYLMQPFLTEWWTNNRSGIFVTIQLCSDVLHCLVNEFIYFHSKQLFGGVFVDVMKVSSWSTSCMTQQLLPTYVTEPKTHIRASKLTHMTLLHKSFTVKHEELTLCLKVSLQPRPSRTRSPLPTSSELHLWTRHTEVLRRFCFSCWFDLR